jgi:hypothetical protein
LWRRHSWWRKTFTSITLVGAQNNLSKRGQQEKTEKGDHIQYPAETRSVSLPIICAAQERAQHGVLHSAMRIRSFVTLLASRSRDQL